MDTLFPSAPRQSQAGDQSLDQFFTPQWACEELVSEFFPDLTSSDLVIEPSCGRGAFLNAIPSHVPAIGVEIDPIIAQEAIENTGRPVIVGDFRTVDLDCRPTAIIGNPPFSMDLIEQFLSRAHGLLPNDGRCGLLLPSYAIQTPSRVVRWADKWSLTNHIVPRTLFPRMIRPLVFIQFVKGTTRTMTGFALYRQAAAMGSRSMNAKAKLILIHGKPKVGCWRALVDWALRRLGGRARLADLYDLIEPHRPTENRFWMEKIRQILQLYFTPVEKGVWSL